MKTARPHPCPLPRERETLFPLLDDVAARDWRGFRGSMCERFGEIPPRAFPYFASPTSPSAALRFPPQSIGLPHSGAHWAESGPSFC
jgi:hypothetical protein